MQVQVQVQVQVQKQYRLLRLVKALLLRRQNRQQPKRSRHAVHQINARAFRLPLGHFLFPKKST
jgi:hypothetical protein